MLRDSGKIYPKDLVSERFEVDSRQLCDVSGEPPQLPKVYGWEDLFTDTGLTIIDVLSLNSTRIKPANGLNLG